MPRRRSRGDVPRTESVFLGATPAELESWRASAEADGLALADWIRGLCALRVGRQRAGLPATGELAPTLPTARAEARVRELIREVPRPGDAAIAEETGLTVDQVRRLREAEGVSGPAQARLAPGARRWREVVGPLFAAGRSVDEIAALTGYKRRSVQTYLSTLRREAREG